MRWWRPRKRTSWRCDAPPEALRASPRGTTLVAGGTPATAFALCRDQKLPIKVFSIFKNGGLKRVVMGEDEGTLVYA